MTSPTDNQPIEHAAAKGTEAPTKEAKLADIDQPDNAVFAAYFDKKVAQSGRPQKDIAREVGFKNPNMISMIKQGHVKLALDRVPAMAKALRIDMVELFKIALIQHYDDETVRLLYNIMENGVSPSERRILELAREAAGPEGIVLTAKAEKKLSQAFGQAFKP